MTHMLFAPTGTLKRRSAEYDRIHADLVLTFQEFQSARLTKKRRAEIKDETYKQTGEVNG